MKIFISVAIGLLIIFLLAQKFQQSNFSNLKKYDEKDSSSRLKLKDDLARKRYYSTDVKILKNNIANLGDFTMNIAGGKKLITNISLKFKENKGTSWMIWKNTGQEILDKGDVLRSAVIGTVSNSKNANVSNRTMKKELVDSMNNYLSDGKIEEIYFNKFIIQ